MNGKQIILATLIALAVAGCASKESKPAFDSSLYDGRPVDTLTSDAPPLNETEAITRGDIALRSNNLDLALYEYIRSLSFPQAEFQDKTLYNIGRIHLVRGTPSLAEKAFLLSVEKNPNNVQSLEQLGSMYAKAGSVDQGASYFRKAINADQIRLQQSGTLKKEDFETLDKVRALPVDNSSPALSFIGLGILGDIDDKHDLAQAYFTQALKIDSKSIKALINLGYSYYMSGDYNTAQRFTLSALEQSPNDEKALNNLALIYLGKGEINRALNVFKQQMETPEALNNIGYFLILQGQADKAVPYLQQAIDKKPTYYKIANENLERALSMIREEKGSE
ncbi:tetratricopeptide repeat protein [Vibrio sonorensis]|uniref:tetratricopeptide repeat protein n=1 Tax=Vibrio sonorensis TaxID=1004316 RepID=UPI0008D93846|nr:tetratricopeptide repeat protein [Vibrio sonorensis]